MVGAHPEVLKALVETNGLHTPGYGCDPFCAAARKLLLEACGISDGEVYFLEGGTQTNAVVIGRVLDYNDGVLSTDTAHINVHEAGAIEAGGHKVIALPNHDGKLQAGDVRRYMAEFHADDTNHYMVRPAMVYISYPTELGTIYSREELAALAEVCREYSLPLYVDGARLAYGLAAGEGELTLKDIAALCDILYVGGTKCGALFGEAVVTRRPELLPRFVSFIKLHGATLAKGRLLGVQFQALFSDGLYGRIGRHAVDLAMMLKSGLIGKGYRQYIDSPTNQQFFILPNETIKALQGVASFSLWGPKREKETPVRFVTDWATTREDVQALLAAL